MDDEVAWALREGSGVACVRDHPHLRSRFRRAALAGELATVLPGIHAHAASSTDLLIRAVAAMRWDPGTVLTRRSAAALTYWRQLAVSTIEVSSPGKHRPQPGYVFSREVLPAELVTHVGPVAVTVPALTALDLALTLGGSGIDEGLRRRVLTLGSMQRALDLTPGRRGNSIRRRLLRESRDRPWSEAERRCHALLHRARIVGWDTNVPVLVAGKLFFLDVAFDRVKLAIEIDGYEAHSRLDQFHRDRRRWTELILDGWTILHVTWDQIVNDPDWVIGCVRRALSDIDLNSRAHLGYDVRAAS